MNKIGIIVSRIDKGAAELLETRLAIELKKMNFDVWLIPEYSSKKFNDSEIQYNLERRHNIKIIRLNFDKHNIIQIFKIRKLNLDVIISHNRGGHLISSIISIGKKAVDIKVMHTYQSQKENQSLTNKLWKLSLQKANFTFHISKNVLNKNINTFNLEKEKSVIVSNAIEINNNFDQIENDTFNIPKGKKIILTVARVHKDKGHLNNLKIIIPILKSSDNIVYVVAGNTSVDPILFKKINSIIKKNEILDKVFYLSQVNNIYSLMNKANVLLHMADREGFGLVLIEALNMGLPIVSSNVGGIPEVMKNTEFELFDINNSEFAADRLLEYVNNFDKEICKNKYRDYVKEFSHLNRAKSFIKYFPL